MHFVWRGSAVLLVVVAACGGDDGGKGGNPTPDAPAPADPNEGAKSGTRLRLQWRSYGETRVLAGVVDNVLAASCTPTAWADGNTYCTPTGARVVYTDAGCTMPVGQVSHLTGCTGTTPTYLLATDVAGCVLRPSHLYHAGARPPTAPTAYYQRDAASGKCVGPTASPATVDYYAVADEILPSQLVALTRTPPAVADAGRLQRRFLTSTDGVALFAGPHDSILDIDCAPVVAPNATAAVCAPTASLANYYHDDKCKQGEVVTGAACTKPAYASQATMPACPSSPLAYFATGDTTTAPPIYTTASCSSTTEPPSSAFYLLGQPLAVTTLSRSRDVTPGRAVQLIHDSDGKTAVRDPLLYDTQHDLECEELPQLDGTTRCLPKTGTVVSYFTDQGCTAAVKVLQILVGGAACTAPAVPKLVTRPLAPMAP
ncbi:MAG TPA: hypothetical protein VGC42_09300, partial [Kofleriaceae bacterium]